MLNRWDDGSARFALIAGRADMAAGATMNVSLSPGAPGSGPAVQESALSGLNATLSFEPFGSVSLAALVGTESRYDATQGRHTPGRVRQLIAGPQMSSWVYYAPLAGHAHLSAWFEVRAYAGGEVEILPWIENGWLDVPSPTSYSGRLTFEWVGVASFAAELTLPNHTRTPALAGAPRPYRKTAAGWLDVVHDTAYLQATRMVPTYQADVAGEVVVGRQHRLFEPMAQLGYPVTMGNTGYSSSIGLIPEWDVAYLVSHGSLDAQAAVLAHGMAAGRYGLHYRDPRTNRPPAFSDWPHLCIGGGTNAGIRSTGSSSKNQYTPTPSGAAPPLWASSHHPSVGYMAYLLSGWHYFCEQTQFAATLNFLKQGDVQRYETQGVFQTDVGANTTRGAAWALRTLAQAALIVREDDTRLFSDLNSSVAHNIDFSHRRYVESPSCPLGICAPYEDYTAGDGQFAFPIWMEDFLTAVWGYIKATRFALDSAPAARLDAFYAWKVRAVIGRLGVPGQADQYHYCDAAQYTMMIAPSDRVDNAGGTGPWYGTWGEVYRATLGKSNTAEAGDTLRGGNFPGATSYWGNLQPALAYAVEHGMAGAAEARARMTGDAGWPRFVSSARQEPVWAVVPAGERV